MTKILLTITHYFRKYQGKDGNAYTIGNAATLVGILLFICLFLINEILYPLFFNFLDKDFIQIIILVTSVIYAVAAPFYLMHKLKIRITFLHYTEYKTQSDVPAHFWISNINIILFTINIQIGF